MGRKNLLKPKKNKRKIKKNTGNNSRQKIKVGYFFQVNDENHYKRFGLKFFMG